MAYYLSQHPEIFVCSPKEPHYFNTDSGHRYYFDEKSYLSLFESAGLSQVYRTDASVWYLYSETAIPEILKFNPDAKFIIMLRDPVSLYFSLHRELLFAGDETERSPVKAWELQESRRQGQNIALNCSDPNLLQYGEACKLGRQLQKAKALIPDDQMFTVFMDDLKQDTDAVYREVLRFLGVEVIGLESYEVINEKKRRKSLALSKALALFTHLKKRLGIKGGLGLANALNKRNITNEVDDISEEIRLLEPSLYEFFREDVELLETLTSRDLSHWKIQKY